MTDNNRNSESLIPAKTNEIPLADALKERFKSGSIPLQNDFADLIDMANVGLRATGQASDQKGSGDGFKLDDSGTLQLKLNPGSTDTDYAPLISVKNMLATDLGSGLVYKTNGICVGEGNGLAVAANSVSLKLAKGSQSNGGGGQGTDGQTSGSAGGLALSSSGLSVDAGEGIQINGKGVSVKLATNSGLSADESNGLKAVVSNGIQINAKGMSVKLATNSGLSADENNGLKVVVSNGIQVSGNGIGLTPEQTFQKGMVMMFAGTESEMPKGWALCDGQNGRPDLRDRFVLGSTGFTNVKQTNNKKVQGNNNAKYFDVISDAKTPSIRVNVQGHTLKLSEIPSHSHSIYTAGKEGSGGQCLFERNGQTPSYKKSFSGSEGGGGSHSHGASATQDSHSHSVNVVPPYYILAFIIKL
ncbi:tail fiber protein [Xenorhabdus griffiniae]|uniref:tail fiber protein n=1 Tax=Xenorhabdus griffiniae TaxID=351672 RepID=UPI0023593692|nr:tail fiber protein [Xenorhabdus griffiniae]MDC9604115.1 tail fiber protein [Xenorhabdus griffiniae]